MTAIFENITALLPYVLIPWTLVIISTLRNPQRFRNCLLLLLALFFTGFFICGLAGDYMGVALGLLFTITFLCVLAVPVVFMVNGFRMLRREGRALPNLLSLLVGIGILVGEVAGFIAFFSLYQDDPNKTLVSITLIAAPAVLYFAIVFLGFMLYSVFIQKIPHHNAFRYIIIHGCGLLDGHRVSKLLANRLDKAIETYHACEGAAPDGAAPILIPSGGKGPDEAVSEAQAMADYLHEHGIPADHIVLEDQSATTYENLANSAAVIARLDALEAACAPMGGAPAASNVSPASTQPSGAAAASNTPAPGAPVVSMPAPGAPAVSMPASAPKLSRRQQRQRVALVSSNYHVYRCLRLARKIGLHCTGIGGRVASYYWPSAIIREFVAVFSQKSLLILLLLGLVIFLSPIVVFVASY